MRDGELRSFPHSAAALDLGASWFHSKAHFLKFLTALWRKMGFIFISGPGAEELWQQVEACTVRGSKTLSLGLHS